MNQVYATGLPDYGSYCEKNGGSYARETFSVSLCKFKDGSECAGWAYYRGDCEPGMYQDWIKEKETKKHVLYYSNSRARFIKYPKELPLITKNEIISDPESVNETDADYVYRKIVVQSKNKYAREGKSEKSEIVLLKDGKEIGRTDINELEYYQTDYVYLYIPIENRGDYSIILETSVLDEAKGNQRFSIPTKENTNRDHRKRKTQRNLRDLRIIIWVKSLFKKVF